MLAHSMIAPFPGLHASGAQLAGARKSSVAFCREGGGCVTGEDTEAQTHTSDAKGPTVTGLMV